MIALAILLAGAVTASAQLPFKVIVPDSGYLGLETSVGKSVTSNVILIRYTDLVESLQITGLEAPFSTAETTISFNGSDTVAAAFTFTPTAIGRTDNPIRFGALGYSQEVVLVGFAVDATPRFAVSPDLIDLGMILPSESREASFTVTNLGTSDLTVGWADPGQFAGFFVDGKMATSVFVPAGSSSSVLVRVNGSALGDGENSTTIQIGDGRLIDSSGRRTIAVEIRAMSRPEGRPWLLINPKTLQFSRYDDEPYPIRQFTITNLSDLDCTIDNVEIPTGSASVFQVSSPVAFPVLLTGGDSLMISVACSPEATGIHTDSVLIWGRELADSATQLISIVRLSSADTVREQAPPIMITMQTNDAKVGEMCRATFTNGGDLPSEVDHGVVTLRYNATVLVPVSITLDDVDPIVDGFRTSRFRLVPSGHSLGDRTGLVEFTVALGNAANTTLDVVDLDWNNANGDPTGHRTSVNGTLVSVLDARGFEVNPSAGPLSVSISPLPASGLTTITYQRGTAAPATMRLVDALGVVVRDLSARVQSEEGSFEINTAGLPSGAYYLATNAGPYSHVLLLTIE